MTASPGGLEQPAASMVTSTAATAGAMPAAMESAVQRLDVASDGAPALSETEEALRLRASEAQPTATPAEKKEQAEHCDAAARDAAESWYSCIEGLREDGLADAARQELEALLIAFPDFREPEQDK